MLGQHLLNMLGQRLYNMLGQRLYNMLGQHFLDEQSEDGFASRNQRWPNKNCSLKPNVGPTSTCYLGRIIKSTIRLINHVYPSILIFHCKHILSYLIWWRFICILHYVIRLGHLKCGSMHGSTPPVVLEVCRLYTFSVIVWQWWDDGVDAPILREDRDRVLPLSV